MAKLTDGYQTLITFSSYTTTFLFFEKEVQPPAMDLGGEIDITTMRNTRLRTKAPKSLVTFDSVTLQVQYDPVMYNIPGNGGTAGFTTIAGLQGDLTIAFPDGSLFTKKAWIESFKPTSHKEGEMPTAEVKFCFPNTTGVFSNTLTNGIRGGFLALGGVETNGTFAPGAA